MLNKNSKIFIAGHNGMVGSAVLRKLKKNNYKNIIIVEKKKINFLDQNKTFNFIKKKKTRFCYYLRSNCGWNKF